MTTKLKFAVQMRYVPTVSLYEKYGWEVELDDLEKAWFHERLAQLEELIEWTGKKILEAQTPTRVWPPAEHSPHPAL